jgi:curved DNA-binding protein
MYTALLGGEVIVTLQAGTKLKLKIKPGTQPGTKVRLRGKGQGGGDLIITYQVTLPATLTDRQRQLLEEMRRA